MAGPADGPGVVTALEAIAAGRPVVVCDDEDREDEGDLIMAADAVTTEWIAFFLRHTSGLLCVGVDGGRLDDLGLGPMVAVNTDPRATAFAVSVDLRAGTTTGISAAERAMTIRGLADPTLGPDDFSSPGHVFPLRARVGGVLARAGHTEAAVDLARLAGRPPAAVLCEIVTADKTGMRRGADLRRFATEHELPLISIADLIGHRSSEVPAARLTRVGAARLPTRHGEFRVVAFSAADATEHLAMVRGDVLGGEPVLVRLHSECLTGDVLGSTRCDCGEQLDRSLARLAGRGRGVLVYLRRHEGRGIGLGAKIRAYGLQDGGRDTVDANLDLGLPIDARDYGVGAEILRTLGVTRVRLLTNNPAKVHGLRTHGVDVVERVPLESRPTPDDIAYLRTKQRRMGHVLHGLGEQRPGLVHTTSLAAEYRPGWGGDTR
ncbi:MAG: 3,4-dihydroxy-2-butanone 4-phosphate synthase [Modestobacter sp.]|nr:3,4-dihydroxy-2-butanone 4-phosphate synthase [Modestobacter sp.]